MTPVKRNIGQLLVDNGQITAEELNLAEAESEKTGESIKAVLSRLGLASENLLKNTLELEYGVGYISIANVKLLPQVVNLIPESVVRECHAVPVAKDGNRITVAMVSPNDPSALEKIKEHLNGLKLKPVVCLEDDFMELVSSHYRSQTSNIISGDQKLIEQGGSVSLGNKDINQLVHLIDIKEDASEAELLKCAQDEAVVLVANQILSGAIKKGSSNIHINCQGNNVAISYRENDVLSADRLLPKAIHLALVARYKFMAKQNIVERHIPQDGHIRVRFSGRDFSCRISFIPTSEGEHIVIWIN